MSSYTSISRLTVSGSSATISPSRMRSSSSAGALANLFPVSLTPGASVLALVFTIIDQHDASVDDHGWLIRIVHVFDARSDDFLRLTTHPRSWRNQSFCALSLDNCSLDRT